MITRTATWERDHQFTPRGICSQLMMGCALVLLTLLCHAAFVDAAWAQEGPREQYIPVLCITPGEKPTGSIIYIMVLFAIRDDDGGLDVHFTTGPGRFSQATQTATVQAIARTARALGLSADSWSVGLSVVDPGVIIEGNSLSAMVGLTVVAMAKGEAIPRSRVITGTVTLDGRIGPVGGVALKVLAARQAGLQMVLVPSTVDSKERMPAFKQVFQVGSVSQAYKALTAPQSSSLRS